MVLGGVVEASAEILTFRKANQDGIIPALLIPVTLLLAALLIASIGGLF